MPRTRQLDPWLLGATALTAAVGVVLVASASAPWAREYYRVAEGAFAIRQAVAVVLGIGVMLAAAFLPLKRLTDVRAALPLLALTWVALAIPYLQEPVAGTSRWLQLPGLSLQPSALAKLTLPLALASLIAWQRSRERSERETFGLASSLIAVTCALVLFEPDLGSAVLLAVAAAGVLVLSGSPWRYLTSYALIGMPVAVAAILVKPYRLERIRAFFGETGYQVHQSLIALGNGGVLGQGPGESVQKLFFLPQPHTDFIFAIAGEELGLVGTTALLALLAVVVVRGLRVAARATTPAAALLAGGLALTIAVQALLNVSVCLNLLPAKGLPLPLVSSGGSDVLATMAMVGLLLNVGKEST